MESICDRSCNVGQGTIWTLLSTKLCLPATGLAVMKQALPRTSQESRRQGAAVQEQNQTKSEGQLRSALPALFLLYSRPRVFQRHGAVEHRLAGLRVGIGAEISQALELVAGSGGGVCQRRFHLRVGNNLQRVRIEIVQYVFPRFHVAGIFLAEQVFVNADF